MNYPILKQGLSALLLSTALCSSSVAWSATLPDAGCSLATLAGNYSWNETTRTDIAPFGLTNDAHNFAYAVSVGREVNDGAGNITAGQMTINGTTIANISPNGTFTYTGIVTVEPNCFGTYRITLDSPNSFGSTDGGGGKIYVDPVTYNFTLLDEFNIGTAKFIKDGSGGGLSSPFPNISWP